jgi:integrase
MRERSPGHWQLRAYKGVHPGTGKPMQESRTFHGSEREAAKALAALVTEVSTGKTKGTSRTVGQLLDRWLEHIEPTHRPKTVAEYKSKISIHIRPALGDTKLSKVDGEILDWWYRKWLSDGLSPTTVHHLHAILSAAFRQAVKWRGWIDEAPTERASPPSSRSTPMRVPTPEQLSELVKRAEEVDPVLATAIALAALTGARRGELVALRWSDVDLTVGRVTIARGITVAGGETHEGPTKTHQIRALALDDFGIGVLRRRWDSMRALSEEADSPLVDDPYVLSYNANGGRSVGPDTLTHRFSALCRAQEAPARKTAKRAARELRDSERWPFRFHDLRHFSVTTLKLGTVAFAASFDMVEYRGNTNDLPFCTAV